MVATARDGSGFDVERDAQPLEGEQPALFEAFTALWRRIELADLPGFYFWQKQAFELLHTHFEELASIFFEYCKRDAIKMSEKFTSHEMLAKIKSFAESNPFSTYNLPRLRKDFGLKPADTWKTLLGQNIPMVIPMMQGTFARPSDWPDRVKLTDFIFLRPPKKEASAPPPDPLSTLPNQIAEFITHARTAERKLVVMTFSSMPVARRKVLECATKMLVQSTVPFSLIYVGAIGIAYVVLQYR